MSSLLKKILEDSVARIFTLIFFGLLLFAFLFVLFGYNYTNAIQQDNELEKLSAIARTTQVNINGDEVDYLLKKYQEEDDISQNQTDSIYNNISSYLRSIKKANNIESDIYILTQIGDSLYFVVTSSITPYYLHTYQQAPKEIFRNWSIGGNCPKYKDENGTWLSSFAPITNTKGICTSIIMIDLNFENFLLISKRRFYIFLFITLAILVVIGFILLIQIKKILKRETELKNELLENKNLLEIINKETESSIYYAKQIQNSVLPKPKSLSYCFDESFIINKPLNIVGGDFWFHAQVKDKAIVIMADCTGHGVPGAFMSLIGFNIIYDIVKNREIVKAAEILKLLNKGIIEILSEEGEITKLRDGMDVSCVVVDKEKQEIEYSGAYRPLVLISNKTKEINEIKGQRFSLGHSFEGIKKEFKSITIKYATNDVFYLFSDGVTDQFGGDRNKKMGSKRFNNYLLEMSDKSLNSQKKELVKKIALWQGNEIQIDDILVLGFKL